MRAGIALVVITALFLWPGTAHSANVSHARGEPVTVVIVTTSAVEVFDRAVAGIERGLGPSAKVTVVDLASHPRPAPIGNLKNVRLMIAVGNNALEHASEVGSAPILATMLLRSDLAASGKRAAAGAVVLDLSLGEILAETARLFPGKTRAAIIRNPTPNALSPLALETEAKAAGMTLKVVDCLTPDRLLQAFLSLRGQVDFVICPPDGKLFNSATVRPLILASLEDRLPVIGFSEAFVRTGAVAGIYPDYGEVGFQTGELARKYLAGAPTGESEYPKKTNVAVNARVARLLGLRLSAWPGTNPGIVVVE